MTDSSELDALIRDARRAENPSLTDRAQVRRAIALRIAGGLGGAATAGEVVALAPGVRRARGAAQRLSFGAGLLPALVVSALLGVSADASLNGRGAGEAPTLPRPPLLVGANEIAQGGGVPSSVLPAAEPLPADAAERPPVRPPSALASPGTSLPLEDESRARDSEVRGGSAPVAGHSARKAVDPSAVGSNLAAESRALAAVQRALRDADGPAALRLLDEQDRTFARGVLGEERAAARVLGWCFAGKPREAELERAAFEARYPRSPLLARVRSGCRASGSP